MKRRLALSFSLILAFATFSLVSAAPEDVPVAYDVDLVVAGGGAGAVATAEAAAKAGAKVLLITDRNYLGEDVAGTMQLWLEPGETPEGELAETLFSDPVIQNVPGLAYTYQADQPTDPRHADTKVPSRLRRTRKATDVQNESVQYPNDVTISADLGKLVLVKEIYASSFFRKADFGVQNVTVHVSTDGTSWSELGSFTSQNIGDRQEFTVPVGKPIRYAKLLFPKQKGGERILLGEIKFVGKSTQATLAGGVALPYTYNADQPSQGKHLDTKVPSLLRRSKRATSAQYHSVEYPKDVTIAADLGETGPVQLIYASSFQRKDDFGVQDVTVQVSTDGETWQELGTIAGQTQGDRKEFTIPVGKPIRHAKLLFRMDKGAQRILLGEVQFVGEATEPEKAESEELRSTRPLHAKKTLETALLDAGASFLFGCYATDLLVDEDGRAAGLLMTNRMGTQAVRAKAVVDATPNAVLARAAGIAFRERTDGPRTARWVMIAEQPTTYDGLTARKLDIPVTTYDLTARRVLPTQAAWYEYSFQTKVKDEVVDRMTFEAETREWLYNKTQLYTADRPILTPDRAVISQFKGELGEVAPAAIPLDTCRAAGIEGLWVVGGCSDIPRELADKLLRPAPLLAVGARLGQLVASEIAGREMPKTVRVAGGRKTGEVEGNVREPLAGLRPADVLGRVYVSDASLPILGSYDVVVVGGGTSGAPAGIAAAREGARTLVLEHLHGLGGTGTLGMIGKYWYGNRVGFAAESPQNPIEERMQFYLSELRKAGGEVWFGAAGCGAVTDGNRVTGVVVATPFGKGVVQAKVVIDGTGNADIAASAGAPTQFVSSFFALQNSHIPAREVGASYMNGNRAPIDAADPIDVTAAMLTFPEGAFDRGQIIASRERRRIIGDYELDWLDQINLRTFPDSIVYGNSDYDSHGYQVHPYFMLKPPRVPGDHRRKFYSYVPYRCLLPRGLDGVLVVGLGISAHRDAMPIVRMQPELMNIGYAAGIAATMSAKTGSSLRQIDIKQLQQKLVEVGILAKDVPSHTDSYPVSDAVMGKAVAGVAKSFDGLGHLLAEPERAKPLLRAAFDRATGESRIAYAEVLGILGDDYAVPTLVEEAEAFLAKQDFKYKKQADGMDRIDQLVWALGHTRNAKATAAIIRLADAGAVSSASRFRAIVVSLGMSRDAAAAPALQRILKEHQGKGTASELMVACALHSCDPTDKLALEILQRMAAGTSAPLAKLAQTTLAE